MNDPASPVEPVRLAKRVVALTQCSRREADELIEGGWVSVDGVIVEEPQHMVADEVVTINPAAVPTTLEPATLLLHKPAGVEFLAGPDAAMSLLSPATRSALDDSGIRLLKRNLTRLTPLMPLEREASGLMVLSQDPSVGRKLMEDGHHLEQEFIVEVDGHASGSRCRGNEAHPHRPHRVGQDSVRRMALSTLRRPVLIADAQVRRQHSRCRRIRARHQPAREKQFDALERNAVACIATVVRLDDASVFVDEKVGWHQIACIEARQTDDTQPLDQRGDAQHDGLDLAPERTLDTIRVVRIRGRVGSNLERASLPRDESHHFGRRRVEYCNDVQTERGETFLISRQFINPEVAKWTSSVAKERKQRATARPTNDDGFAVDIDQAQRRGWQFSRI